MQTALQILRHIGLVSLPLHTHSFCCKIYFVHNYLHWWSNKKKSYALRNIITVVLK